MNFLFDNMCPSKLVEAIRDLIEDDECNVMHLREKFKDNISDPELFLKLAKEKDWVVISADQRITKGKNRDAWQESGITVINFPNKCGDLPLIEQAWRILKVWKDIVHVANKKYTKAEIIQLKGNIKDAWSVPKQYRI